MLYPYAMQVIKYLVNRKYCAIREENLSTITSSGVNPGSHMLILIPPMLYQGTWFVGASCISRTQHRLGIEVAKRTASATSWGNKTPSSIVSFHAL